MDKPFFLAIRGKVISAFLLGCVAIALALGITYFSFNGLLKTVDQLSSPNEKLNALHNLFQRITQLDQEQRAEAIRNPGKLYGDFLKDSKAILLTLDTLRAMTWSNKRQVKRLLAMEEILNKRSQLFLSYLELKSNYIYNKRYAQKLDTLNRMLAVVPSLGDTNVTTTKKKTVTTTYVPPATEKDTRSVLSRLFGKKKPKPADNARVEVQEELSIQIDTLSVAQQDSAFLEVGKLIRSLQADQHLQNRKVVERELELINTNTVLSSQLLSILQEVEKEELQQIRKNNSEASIVVNTGIKRMSGVMIIFLLGTAVLVFLILTDVAKSNYYRQQLIRSKEEAEALSQVKQRFMANMSHEIRTPLQSIIGFAEQLKENGSTNSEALAAIHSSSDHLLHIVNEVLDYSRIESGKFKLIHEPFNLGDLLQEVSSGMRIQAENRRLIFRVQTSGNSNVTVLGDAFRLRQILYNLLGNAIKFTEKGFVKFDVAIEETQAALNCRFSVVDSGIGIKSDEISRVFQQFEQADDKTSTHYGGSGLGLTIVKALVDAQHGQLQVDSEIGKGSSFTVLLNFDKAVYENALHVDPQNGQQKTKPDPVRHVLVVDDDPLILRLCAIILQKHGIAYKTFQDSSMVLENVHNDIDLVLLDIRMPNVSGIDLCKALRNRINAGARIIALTAHILPEEHAPLMAAGFDEVLAKPFREKQLLDLLGVSSPGTDLALKPNDASVDFSILRKMTMGDESLFQSVLSQFMEETQADVYSLEVKLNHMDILAVREIVHKLTGRVGQIGAQKLSAKLRAIETDLDKGKSLRELVERIIQALDGVKELLKKIQEVVI